MKTFEDIYRKVAMADRKTIAVAAADDEPVLEAVKQAIEKGLANAVLVGNEENIRNIAEKIDFDLDKVRVIDAKDTIDAALEAVKLVSSNEAHILMKGLIGTADFLRAVLNKEYGLRTGKTLSHVTVIKVDKIDRFILMTDAAMNMYPSLEDKVKLLENVVPVCEALEIESPKAAAICAVEVVNPAMPPTMDAAALAMMSQRGQIKGITVDGPLALDNALSEESARHKGIVSPVAGKADVLLMPNIESGNIMWKTLTHMAEANNAGVIVGAAAPVVMTSRADEPETKLNSLALGLLMANN